MCVCTVCVCVHFYVRRNGTEIFYLMMHSTHFNYGYVASDIW